MSGFVWLLKEETTRLLKSSLVLYDFVHLAKLFDKKDRNAQQTPSVTHSLPGLRAGSLYVSQTQCTETNYKLKRMEVTSIHQAGSLSSTINRALCIHVKETSVTLFSLTPECALNEQNAKYWNVPLRILSVFVQTNLMVASFFFY